MKNKPWIKTINIILAAAMLLGNMPDASALRTEAARQAGTDREIGDDLKGSRGAATGYITRLEHEIVNNYLREKSIRQEKYRLRTVLNKEPKEIQDKMDI